MDDRELITYHAAPRGIGYKYFENSCYEQNRGRGQRDYTLTPATNHDSISIRQLQLPTLINHHLRTRRTTPAAKGFHFLDHIHAFDDGAEDDVFAVEPFGLGGTEEELRAVGTRTGVSHAENAWAGVLQSEVFVSELGAVDGLATGAIVVSEIAALAHETGDDAVEAGAGKAKALFASAESTEILSCLGHNVAAELNNNPAQRLAISSDIQVTAGEFVSHWCSLSLLLSPPEGEGLGVRGCFVLDALPCMV
jgi:hypothetical protein